MAMYGATIGALGILEVPSATNQACAAFLPKPETASITPYLFYFLLANRERFRSAAKGGAQPNISQSIIKAFPLRLPPASDRERIVGEIVLRIAHLSSIESCLERVQRRCAVLRKCLLKETFQGRAPIFHRGINFQV